MIKSILLYVPTLSAGGAERVCVNLANHWAEVGKHIAVATLSAPESDHYPLHPAVKRHSLGLLVESSNPASALIRNMCRANHLRRYLRKLQPEVAIAFMSSANVVLAFARMGLHSTVFIGSEHTHPPKLPLSNAWEKLRSISYGQLDAVTALTESSAAWIRSHTSARHVVVIPNPITYPLPNHPPIIDPCSIGVRNRRRLLAVGRLTYQKGFDLLINAFSQLAEDFPDWELVILGEGELRGSLHDQMRKLGLVKTIFMPGVVGNLADWLNSAQLFVMSSRFEGFGNVLVEAMNYGLPAVSFDCETGPSDIIRHEIDGLLVPNENVEALAIALRRLMSDEKTRNQYSEHAKECRERFSMQGVVEKWEQLMHTCTSKD